MGILPAMKKLPYRFRRGTIFVLWGIHSVYGKSVWEKSLFLGTTFINCGAFIRYMANLVGKIVILRDVFYIVGHSFGIIGQICVGKIVNYISGGNFLVWGNLKSLFGDKFYEGAFSVREILNLYFMLNFFV